MDGQTDNLVEGIKRQNMVEMQCYSVHVTQKCSVNCINNIKQYNVNDINIIAL